MGIQAPQSSHTELGVSKLLSAEGQRVNIFVFVDHTVSIVTALRKAGKHPYTTNP